MQDVNILMRHPLWRVDSRDQNKSIIQQYWLKLIY